MTTKQKVLTAKARVLNPAWTSEYRIKTGDIVGVNQHSYYFLIMDAGFPIDEVICEPKDVESPLPTVRLIAGTLKWT